MCSSPNNGTPLFIRRPLVGYNGPARPTDGIQSKMPSNKDKCVCCGNPWTLFYDSVKKGCQNLELSTLLLLSLHVVLALLVGWLVGFMYAQNPYSLAGDNTVFDMAMTLAVMTFFTLLVSNCVPFFRRHCHGAAAGTRRPLSLGRGVDERPTNWAKFCA